MDDLTEARMFEEDMNLFFDILFKKMEEGEISPDRVEAFFPDEVIARALEDRPSENV